VAMQINRRRHERFHVEPGFTPVRVNAGGERMDGHTYDLSESGLQFELDRAVAPGTHVLIEIELPVPLAGSREIVERVIGASAEVVWADESEPGPARMAAVFTGFANASHRDRLFRALSRPQLRRAA